jgi:predicted nuclease with TOPRIM domain
MNTKEPASNKVINALARKFDSEMKDLRESVGNLEQKIDERLSEINENLAQHMKRTAILEDCRQQDVQITKENTRVIERIIPVLTRYEAAETAAKWLYKPAFLLALAAVAYLSGAKGEVVLELLKKVAGV